MAQQVKAYIVIFGKVQGVFYRDSMRRQAEQLGLYGWVYNAPNGEVEAEVEGEKDKVLELIQWAKEGPLGAKVDDVKVDWKDYKGEFNSFIIK